MKQRSYQTVPDKILLGVLKNNMLPSIQSVIQHSCRRYNRWHFPGSSIHEEEEWEGEKSLPIRRNTPNHLLAKWYNLSERTEYTFGRMLWRPGLSMQLTSLLKFAVIETSLTRQKMGDWDTGTFFLLLSIPRLKYIHRYLNEAPTSLLCHIPLKK